MIALQRGARKLRLGDGFSGGMGPGFLARDLTGLQESVPEACRRFAATYVAFDS